MNKIILIALVVIVSFSCKKENECCTDVPQINPLGSTELLLTIPHWMIVEGSYTVDGEVENWYEEWDECMQDNLLKLNGDGSAVLTENLLLCNPDDPSIIENGTWSLTTTEDQLVLNSVAFNIAVLSQSTLKLTLIADNSGNPILNSVTYMAQ